MVAFEDTESLAEQVGLVESIWPFGLHAVGS